MVSVFLADFSILDKEFRDPAMLDLNHHPADAAKALIVGAAWNAEGPRSIPMHRHRRGQLIYAARGCVTVETADCLFVVPPNRAVWVPPELEHSASYPREVAFRGIFVAPELCADLPRDCSVVQIDGLARELIEAASAIDWTYPPDGAEARLMRVLLDRIKVLRYAALSLPDARDKRLKRVTAELRAAPGDMRPLTHWAAVAGMSERNFTRLFLKETRMSFGAWRQQLKLVRAIERLAAGESVTQVGVDLGYVSTSSFTSMFKRATGLPPSAYFDGPRGSS